MKFNVVIKLSLGKEVLHLQVKGDYSYDPGVHTYPNGDPGYPPSEECEIESIMYKGNDISDLFYAFDDISSGLYDKIIELCINQIQKKAIKEVDFD